MHQKASYSITSSARASSVGGTLRPSALAVLRLMTSSNLVGCPHRQVGRLLALEDAAGIDADLTKHLGDVGSVAHQPADFDNGARGMQGDRMACRQLASWSRRLVKKGISAYEEGVGPLARKSCEGRIDFVAGAGVEDLNLQPHGARCRFHIPQCGLRAGGIARIDEHGHTRGCGHQLTQEFQPLCRQLRGEKLTPVRLPPGRARLATRPSLTGSSPTVKTTGIVVVAALAANAAGGPPLATITATCRLNQFGRQRWQPIDLILGPAMLDRHVLALDMAGVLEAWRNARSRS